MSDDQYPNLYMNLNNHAVKSLRIRIVDQGSMHHLGEWLIPLPEVARAALERYGISVAVFGDVAEAGPDPIPIESAPKGTES